MKIALDWIAEYLAPLPSPAHAAELLMNAGLPVESTTPFQKTHILDVEVTSNRTDCFSHLGLARELSALTAATFTPPTVAFTESGKPTAADTSVTIHDPVGCPYYSARLIRNIKVAPSPHWLVQRLESIGLRSINNIVDITNYVLMELGQPLHAFDFDKLAEKKIIVRRAHEGEKLQAIDAKEYTLDPTMLVIADAQNPVAIAGVMGGKSTEVTDQTTTILLESARFEPLTIRTTSRALTLKSDSSYRFERGIDPTMADLASRRAAQLILQLAGGEIAPDPITVGSATAPTLTISMRLNRLETILGIVVPYNRIHAILHSLGFSPQLDGDKITVKVPHHRLDITREIDIIEEVARIYGYQHIPTLDRVSHPVRPETPAEKAGRTIMNTFVEAGFSEAVTVTFIPESEAKEFVPINSQLIRTQHSGWKGDVLRPSLLPSLLSVRRTNQNAGTLDARLFEKAEIFYQTNDPGTVSPTNSRTIAAVATDLSALTALLTLLPARLHPGIRMWAEPSDHPMFARGASAHVLMQKDSSTVVIGRVGLFTNELQRKYDLRHTVAGIELAWDTLIEIFAPVRRANAIPRFPGVKRDLSVVLDESVRWAEIKTAIDAAKLNSLEQAEFVTTFRNKTLGEGKKSLTLALDFREAGRTLTSEEVDSQVQVAVQTLASKFGATLRA